MSWIMVVHKRGFSKSTLDNLADNLQEIVASALHVPEVKEANLAYYDVDLFIREAGSRDRCHSINILIHAPDYPERKVDIQERVAKIANEVNKIVNWNAANPDRLNGTVYITNMEGFAEF